MVSKIRSASRIRFRSASSELRSVAMLQWCGLIGSESNRRGFSINADFRHYPLAEPEWGDNRKRGRPATGRSFADEGATLKSRI